LLSIESPLGKAYRQWAGLCVRWRYLLFVPLIRLAAHGAGWRPGEWGGAGGVSICPAVNTFTSRC